jgi:DNA-binding MarR family transcriptional regulator
MATTSSSICLCTLVRKTDRALNRLYDDALRPANIATTQFALLRNIERQPSPPALTELAEIMRMDRTTLSRNLHPLQRDGFVTISSGPDRRTKSVALTPAGRTKIAEALPFWRSVQGYVASALGPTDHARIESELFNLLSVIDELQPAQS